MTIWAKKSCACDDDDDDECDDDDVDDDDNDDDNDDDGDDEDDAPRSTSEVSGLVQLMSSSLSSITVDV